jgi:sarcosine oxidase subunit delta
MLIVTCPNCGLRNASEFRHGGEHRPRPRPERALSQAEWAEYLYMRRNVMGVQKEWWYHRAGCGLWFLAERDTRTNQVLRTYLWQPEAEGGGRADE